MCQTEIVRGRENGRFTFNSRLVLYRLLSAHNSCQNLSKCVISSRAAGNVARGKA
jgi:hypothetical protein